jgi:hypothetical protein
VDDEQPGNLYKLQSLKATLQQGCQIVYLQTQIQNCWYIIWPFGLFYGHLLYYTAIWYIFSTFWYVVPIKIWQPCFAAASKNAETCHRITNIQVSQKPITIINLFISYFLNKRLHF